MALAQAEQTKGDAAMMREETSRMNVMNQAQNRNADTKINQFRATTDRLSVQVDAKKAQADLDFKRSQEMNRQANDAFRARVSA